ncbi:MAG: ABC transporter permease [Bacillota bacterium]
MFSKIMRVAGIDVKIGFRETTILYILIFPLILAFILKALTASNEIISLNVVIDPSVSSDMEEYLDQYGKIEAVDSREDMEERVRKTDDYLGVYWNGESYTILQQGNEEDLGEVLEFVINSMETRNLDIPAEVRISDVGWTLSPMKQYGGSLLVIFMSVMGGMVIVLNLIEEKTSNTLAAINVSPVTRREYVMGKSFIGFVVSIFQVLATLLILDYGDIDILMVIVVTLSIALISILIGFLIGVTNDDIMGGMASMKAVFTPVLASVFGAIFLSSKWQVLLYWSPFYWAFRSMDSIILRQATWGGIMTNTGIILGLTGIVFLALHKRIRRGLN